MLWSGRKPVADTTRSPLRIRPSAATRAMPAVVRRTVCTPKPVTRLSLPVSTRVCRPLPSGPRTAQVMRVPEAVSARRARSSRVLAAECPEPTTMVCLPACCSLSAPRTSGRAWSIRSAASGFAVRGQPVGAERVGGVPRAGRVDDRAGGELGAVRQADDERQVAAAGGADPVGADPADRGHWCVEPQVRCDGGELGQGAAGSPRRADRRWAGRRRRVRPSRRCRATGGRRRRCRSATG